MRDFIKTFKNLHLLWFSIFFTTFFMNAQCPIGSTVLTSSMTSINNGEVVCASSNVTIPGVLTINQGGKLYIESGVVLTSKGNLLISGGEVHVLSGAGLYAEGGISLGAFGSQNNALLKIYDKAYFSANGSLMQGDPSHSGYYPGFTSILEMGAGAIGEICATFTQQSSTYPFINYTGDGSLNAFFILRSQASGGSGSILTESNHLDFITMSSVSSLDPGGANWSGESASPDASNIPWPEGLTNGAGVCGEAQGIIDKFQTERKLLITNPMIYQILN